MSTEIALLKYDAMCTAIAECHGIDEVKDITDKAVAMQAYYKQINNRDAERYVFEIRVRASRKAGELLAAMEKAKGAKGNPGGRGAPIVRSEIATTQEPLTLAQMGISKDESSAWQALAKMPEPEFEHALKAAPITSSNIVDFRPKTPDGKGKVSKDALWVWGQITEFQTTGVMNADIAEVCGAMTQTMLKDIQTTAPALTAWLIKLVEVAAHEREKISQ